MLLNYRFYIDALRKLGFCNGQSVSSPKVRPVKLELATMILLTLNFTNMRRKFTESQIVAAIKKQENGIPVKEICREIGISDATFYNWKAKYGGMNVSEVVRTRELEKENTELKKMFAEMSLENRAMKLLIEKKL